MKRYAPLHVHSDRSFLDGYATLEANADRAVFLGLEALAITDHQEVGGHLAHRAACEARGIRPLYGMEGYLTDHYAQAVADQLKPADFSHVTLIAKTTAGLHNLWAWSSDAYRRKFYYRALQDWAGVAEFGADLWATDGCLLAWMARAIVADDEERCHELMGRYLAGFSDNFAMELHTWRYLDPADEVQHRLNAEMTKVNQAKVGLATSYGVPLIVVNDSHYANPEEWYNHQLVWQMRTHGGGKKDEKGMDLAPAGQTAAWMMDEDDLVFHMARHGIAEQVTREAVANTAMIAESCDVEIVAQERMPRVTESEDADRELFLRHIESGFARKIEGRGLDVERYHARLEYEAKLILEKGLPGYFNVVADYTKAAKTKMIMGPGRGSAAGSLCAWCMDITEMDPLKYGLPFERFMNPDRVGYPDIDLDFPQQRRPEVRQDLAVRFGVGNVVNIGTLVTLGPKGILRDLGRVMDIPWADREAISRIFDKAHSNDPDRKEITWEEMIEQLAGDLTPYMRRHSQLFDRMSEMVGMVRTSGKHASGVLISSEPLGRILPLRVHRSGQDPTTAFTFTEVELLGFVKFDVLGLRHLDTIEECCRLIGMDYRELYAWGDEHYADPAIWAPIHAGDTTGIFQLETADMTRIARRFRPVNEVEVADLISANRPGVIYARQLEPFLRRREGVEPPAFQHPMTAPHLQRTFGVIVYQEQIMEIVKDLARFGPGDADSVRSAVAKKKQEALERFYDRFIDGCLDNPAFRTGSETGDPRADAEAIWRSIRSSGSYAFSLNHAQAYAIIAAWEVWLRHYHYKAFVTALLSTDKKKEKDEPPRTALYMRHARMHGVEILGPDVNTSDAAFRPVPEGIRYGLDYIHGIGPATTATFLPERENGGPFAGFEDFLERTRVNRGAVFTMIRIGCFDGFGVSRRALWLHFRDILLNGSQRPKRAKLAKADREKLAREPVLAERLTDEQLYRIEVELTGSFITRDPMAPYLQIIAEHCIESPEALDALAVGQTAIVGGQITKLAEHRTRRGRNPGQLMAFLTIEWNYQLFEVVVFPREYERHLFLSLAEDMPVAIRVVRTDRSASATEIERLDWLVRDVERGA